MPFLTVQSISTLNSICCFSASFVFDPFPTCNNYTNTKFQALKGNFNFFIFSFLVHAAVMYKTEVISI